mmetsp:Transcript_10766/g.18031  ORF Transcript_10766/g.18031 Transcript_10766/m.18031 type:complete len:226 (+) Transcript_10766:987-1664(+)
MIVSSPSTASATMGGPEPPSARARWATIAMIVLFLVLDLSIPFLLHFTRASSIATQLHLPRPHPRPCRQPHPSHLHRATLPTLFHRHTRHHHRKHRPTLQKSAGTFVSSRSTASAMTAVSILSSALVQLAQTVVIVELASPKCHHLSRRCLPPLQVRCVLIRAGSLTMDGVTTEALLLLAQSANWVLTVLTADGGWYLLRLHPDLHCRRYRRHFPRSCQLLCQPH